MFLNKKSLKFWLSVVLALILLILVSFALNGAEANQLAQTPPGTENFNPEAYATWRNSFLQDENGNIPDNALAKALAEKEKLVTTADPKRDFAGVYAGGWQELGPNNVGGRVRALLIHPTTPNTMWAGAAGGGIWKTTDGGTSWFPTNMPIMPVSTMVIDPDNANILYAGTGEGFYNLEAIRGQGIYKSTNGGIDWTQLGATTGTNFQYINRLAIAKVSGQTTILAATRVSIYRSTDAGNSWPQATITAASGVMDVEFNPNDSTRAVASSDTGKAWYSTDGGLNWTNATFTQGVSTNSAARVEIAYAKSANGTVFASVNGYQGGAGGNQVYGEIYKSTNNGQNYSRVNSGDGYLGVTAGRYANSIWVDPTDANRLLVGGIELWRSTNAISGGSNVLISQISRGVLNPANPGYYQHAIVAHPGYNGTSNRTVFVVGDGGIFKATDILNTNSVAGWQNLNSGLAITQLFDAKIHPLSGVIYAGSQGQGILRYTSNAFGWQRHAGAGENLDTINIALDPTDPNLVYATGAQLAVYRSTDAGATTDYINTGITEALSDTANRFAPILLDPNNPKWLYGGAISLWRTQNVTATVPFWQNIRGDSGGCSSVNCIRTLSLDSTNSSILWVGFGNGRVYRSTNATTTPPNWTTIDDNSGTNPLPNRAVTSLYLSQAVTKPVYATFGGYNTGNIWRGTTNGGSWANIHNNLPAMPIYVVVDHPTIPGWLYAGTETGLYTSENGGTTWNAATDGPNNAPVYELFWRGNTLYAVTFGRGLFKIDVPGNAPNLLNVNVAFDDSEFGNANGRIDSNEGIALQVTLRNAGAVNATAITGSLVVTSGNAVVVENTASYPNLGAYGVTGANATNYVLAVNQGTACNAKIYLRQTVYYNTTLTKTFDFVLTVGSVQNTPAQAFNYTGASVAIPDNAPGGVEIPLAVNKTGLIEDINVSVNITHEFVSDLSLALVAPSGQTVLLASKRGSSGQNYSGTLFDDEALVDITTGSAPFSGSFQPEQLLSTLDGSPISGTWKLRVIDTTEGELGGVISYSLTIREKVVACDNLVSPSVTALFPTATNAGANGLTVAVYGTNFITTTVARWNGTDLPTTYLSPTLLLAQVDAAKVAAPQVVPITVFTPNVGGLPPGKDFTVNTVCDRLIVSSTADSNACGTFREALTYVATPGISNTQITLALSLPATITFSLTSPLPALESGSSIVGFCHPGYGPTVALNGINLTNGLTAQGNNLLRGLKIYGFGSKQLTLPGVGVRVQCMNINEN